MAKDLTRDAPGTNQPHALIGMASDSTPPGARAVDRVDRLSRERAARGHGQAALIEQLSAIREQLLEAAEGWRPWIEGRDADRDASARNLLQYLALRGHDLRALQDPLVALGLSSLGGSESHVQASVDAVLDALSAIANRPSESRPGSAPIGFARSRDVLAVRTATLLGPVPRRRPTRIMVTMPTEAATDGAGRVAEHVCWSTYPARSCARARSLHSQPQTAKATICGSGSGNAWCSRASPPRRPHRIPERA